MEAKGVTTGLTGKSYFNKDYLETTTKDKRNVILQSYAVWSVEDPLLYYNSVGSQEKADSYIKDQIFSATNSTMGAYKLSALVSLDKKELNTDAIQEKIFKQVQKNCKENYGIKIADVNILRISLPDTNLQSVFDQMIAERQKEIDTILAEAERDSSIIVADADAKVCKILESETEISNIKEVYKDIVVLKNEDGEIVSQAVTVRKQINCCAIGGVITLERHRGHGYAKRLVHTISNKLLKDGYKKVVLHVNSKNEPAISIYTKIGFKKIDETAKVKFYIKI